MTCSVVCWKDVMIYQMQVPETSNKPRAEKAKDSPSKHKAKTPRKWSDTSEWLGKARFLTYHHGLVFSLLLRSLLALAWRAMTDSLHLLRVDCCYLRKIMF